MLKQIIRLGGILCLITLLVVLLLGTVNELTKDIIAQNLEKTENAAREELIPAGSFNKIGDNVYEGKNGSELLGYCVKITSKGFGGDINMLVGFDKNFAVSGIKIIEHSETAGLGSKITQPEFSERLSGKKPVLTVNGGENPVDAISGATISSKAAVSGVNEAYELLVKATGGDK